MKFTSIFFTASASIFEIYLNDTNKRARNMKFTSIFFTASASIFEIYLNDTNKRARKINIRFMHAQSCMDCLTVAGYWLKEPMPGL